MVFGAKQGRLSGTSLPGHKHKPGAAGGRRTIPKIALLAIAIVVVAAAVAFLLLSSGTPGTYDLSSNMTLQLAVNKSVLLQISSSPVPFALQFTGSKPGGYYAFYLSRTPVLSNPIYSFALSKGQAVNISTAGTQAANLKIELVSATNSSVMVLLTPVPLAFGIKASGVTVLNPQSGRSPPSTVPSSTTSIAPSKNTSQQPNTTTNPVTTVTAVKSSIGGNYTEAQVMLAANETEYGKLMNDYNSLYVTDQGCTESSYDSAYTSKFNSAPSGPNSYANVSQLTPYAITHNVSYVAGNMYKVTYSTVSHSKSTTGAVLSLTVDANSGSVANYTFEGPFAGQSYAGLNGAYATASGVSGSCGAYLP